MKTTSKKELIKRYGKDIQFEKSVTGREFASIPLSDEDIDIIRMSESDVVYRFEGEKAIKEKLTDKELRARTRKCIAAKDIFTGDWHYNISGE